MAKQKTTRWNKKKHTHRQLKELRAIDAKYRQPRKPIAKIQKIQSKPPSEPESQRVGKRTLHDISIARKTMKAGKYAP